MGREEILLSMFNKDGRGLEIGPSYNPLLPKSLNPLVETLDYTDKAGLVEKYRDVPGLDITKIEDVDFVSDGRPMVKTIGCSQRYDFIVASHVIEHTPNMVRFLNECATLLKPDGILVLAVPDKRFCFDFLRPITSTGEILKAHNEERSSHTPETYFDFFAGCCKRGGAIGWDETCVGDVELRYEGERARAEYKKAFGSTVYLDTHAWVYTPSSFRLILKDLNELEIVELRETIFHSTVGFEFYIALSFTGTGSQMSRLQLAMATEQELSSVATRELLEANTTLTANLEGLRSTIELKNAELHTANQTISELRARMASVNDEFLRMQLSKSWRFTAPLRALRSRF